MNLLKKIWQKVWKRMPSQTPNQAPPDQTAAIPDQEAGKFRAGWVLFWSLLLIGMIFLFKNFPLGLAILGINALYIGTCLNEIKSPDIAFLFKRGKFTYPLNPGWYLTIPHFWTIETISQKLMEEEFKEETMYTSAEQPIGVKFRVFYKVVDIGKALFTKDVIKNRVRAVILTNLKGEVGGKSFAELLTDRNKLEGEITISVNEELAKDGYNVIGIEIEDFTENVRSQAATIRTLGKARGEAAQALAQPLKDNYPAAAVNVFTILTETAEKIAKTIWVPKGKQTSAGTTAGGESEDTLKKLLETAQQIAGKK